MLPEIDRYAINGRIQNLVTIKGGASAVARLCGLPEPTIEYWINAGGLPGSVALARLAQGCEVSAHWILFGRDRPAGKRSHG